jgi:hypothetical protein
MRSVRLEQQYGLKWRATASEMKRFSCSEGQDTVILINEQTLKDADDFS